MPASVPREMEAMIVVVVEVEDTAAVEAASATNATGLDILPANAGRRRTVATNVTELDTLQGTVARKRIPATIVIRSATS